MDTDLFVECLKENMCCLEVFSVHKDRDNNTISMIQARIHGGRGS